MIIILIVIIIIIIINNIYIRISHNFAHIICTCIYIHTCFPLSDIPIISSRYHVSIMLGLITDPWYRICQPCDMVFFHSGQVIATWQRSHHQCWEVYHGLSQHWRRFLIWEWQWFAQNYYTDPNFCNVLIFCHEIRARKLEHRPWAYQAYWC